MTYNVSKISKCRSFCEHKGVEMSIIRPRRCRNAAAYSRKNFPWTICRFVRTYVRRSVSLSSALWKTADRIRMPFGIISRTSPGMRQVVAFGDRSTGRGTFGARPCNQWGLFGICVRQRRDAALFPNYFGQTYYYYYYYPVTAYSML